ncbi:MAG: GLPGLI family protein [Flavobacteriaceae bacterium]|nr:GLPGLI family protein [Flavobacteriaceae bacterium]
MNKNITLIGFIYTLGMKKISFKRGIIFLMVLLWSFKFSAQSYRFYYELRYAPDSTQKEIKKTELYILDYDTQTNESLFYSNSHIKNDSINKRLSSMMNLSSITVNMGDFKDSYINEIIEKKDSEYNIYSIIDGDFFTYKQDIDIKWKIENEKLEILEYECISAETDFGGRKWKAYYTADLPFASGPYKFGGLPGLILKISDEDKDFEFTIAGINKIENSTSFNFSKYIPTNENKYVNQYKLYVEDPVKSMREGVIITEDGTKYFMKGGIEKSIIEEEQKSIYDDMRKNNNCLEKDSKICTIQRQVLSKLKKDRFPPQSYKIVFNRNKGEIKFNNFLGLRLILY